MTVCRCTKSHYLFCSEYLEISQEITLLSCTILEVYTLSNKWDRGLSNYDVMSSIFSVLMTFPTNLSQNNKYVQVLSNKLLGHGQWLLVVLIYDVTHLNRSLPRRCLNDLGLIPVALPFIRSPTSLTAY